MFGGLADSSEEAFHDQEGSEGNDACKHCGVGAKCGASGNGAHEGGYSHSDGEFDARRREPHMCKMMPNSAYITMVPITTPAASTGVRLKYSMSSSMFSFQLDRA